MNSHNLKSYLLAASQLKRQKIRPLYAHNIIRNKFFKESLKI